jgi:hypothetical protein
MSLGNVIDFILHLWMGAWVQTKYKESFALRIVFTLQQNVFMYAKWFHKILNEFTCPSEWDLVGMQWMWWSNEWGLLNCTNIL